MPNVIFLVLLIAGALCFIGGILGRSNAIAAGLFFWIMVPLLTLINHMAK